MKGFLGKRESAGRLWGGGGGGRGWFRGKWVWGGAVGVAVWCARGGGGFSGRLGWRDMRAFWLSCGAALPMLIGPVVLTYACMVALPVRHSRGFKM